jgi:hypothetical protein
MANVRSAEAVKQRHIAAMGQQLGEMYHALFNDLVRLHFKWPTMPRSMGKVRSAWRS